MTTEMAKWRAGDPWHPWDTDEPGTVDGPYACPHCAGVHECTRHIDAYGIAEWYSPSAIACAERHALEAVHSASEQTGDARDRYLARARRAFWGAHEWILGRRPGTP